MKKLFTLFVLLTVCVFVSSADNTLSVENITIPRGGTGTIEVVLDNDDAFTAFQATLQLPDGISFVSATKSNRLSANHQLSISDHGGGEVGFVCIDMVTLADITGNSGVLFTVEVSADETLDVGTVLNANMSNLEFKQGSGGIVRLAEIPFTIEVTEMQDYVTLDENSFKEPEASDGAVKVKVLRTINANRWSTICLPFGMSVEKLKAAFGDDYELAILSGIDVERSGSSVNTILVSFSTVTKALVANQPYIIKTSQDITEFWAEDVTINPKNTLYEIKEVDDDMGEVVTIASMTGTYVNGTVVPAKSLVISNNSFWYSVGKTTTMGFRAYFTFNEVLSSYDDAQAGARVKLMLSDGEGEPTEISMTDFIPARGTYYDLKGMPVANPVRGIYVKDGKKVVVK